MSTGYTTVAATNLVDATGTPIANATISFAPVDNSGKPLSFRAGGSGGQVCMSPVTTLVTNGAFTINVADTSLTSPVNAGYAVTVVDNVTGDTLLQAGYGCVQPTGSTFNFDTLEPNFAAQVSVQTGPQGQSAYQVWLGQGNTGTEKDFLGTLVGPLTTPQLAAYVQAGQKANRNLFDPTQAINDILIHSADGSTFSAPGLSFFSTGRIPCTGGATYTANQSVIASDLGWGFWDITGTYLSGIPAAAAPQTVTAPTGSAFMQVGFGSNQAANTGARGTAQSTLMIVGGSAVPAKYLASASVAPPAQTGGNGFLVYQKSQWTNTLDFTSTLGSGMAISAGQVYVAGSTNDFTGSLSVNATQSADENVDFEASFIVKALGSQTYAVSIGKLSTNAVHPDSLAIALSYNNGSPYMRWLAGNGSTVTDPGAGIGIGNLAVGDQVRLVYSQRGGSYTAFYTNTTQGTSCTLSLQDTYTSAHVFSSPNSSKLAIFPHGGTFAIDGLRVISRQPLQPNVAFMGDSKTWGFNAGQQWQRFASLVDALGPIAVYGGQADTTAECLANVPYVVATSPKYVVLCIGRNDIQFGIATSVMEANYSAIVTALKSAGITVVHLLPIPDSLDQSTLKNYITSTFASDVMIDVSGGWNAAYLDSTDNIHPTPAGHAYIASQILASSFMAASSIPALSQPLSPAVCYPFGAYTGVVQVTTPTGTRSLVLTNGLVTSIN